MRITNKFNKNRNVRKYATAKTFKEFSKKQLVDKVYRKELYDLVGTRQQFSGDTMMKGSRRTKPKAIILQDVVVAGEYIEHVWVELDRADWVKLAVKSADIVERLYMEGEVYKYSSSHKASTKIGLRKVKLVTEIDNVQTRIYRQNRKN